MNLKKYVTATVAICVSMCAFAYPAPQEEDPVTPLLQQYTAQIQELQKIFDARLLPPLQSLAKLGLAMQDRNQITPTFEQTQEIETLSNQLNEVLNTLVEPAIKDIEVNTFNEQYKQVAQEYNLPAQEFTLQDITEMFKGMYLISALGYFEQTKKLSREELTVLAEIFFRMEEAEN